MELLWLLRALEAKHAGVGTLMEVLEMTMNLCEMYNARDTVSTHGDVLLGHRENQWPVY